MQGYQFIGHRPQLTEQVAALHAAAFGLDPSTSAAYLAWKYERNPYIAEPLLVLARDPAGAIVGMRGFYGTRWTLNGSSICIPCADDFAIADRARNSGLATSLMKASLDELKSRGFEFVLNMSGGTITVLQQLAMGWKRLGSMEPVARRTWRGRTSQAVVNRSTRLPILHRLARHLGPDASTCFAHLDRSSADRLLQSHGVTVSKSPQPVEMAALAVECANEQLISHARDANFFQWRFLNPARDYRFIRLERNGALAGYLVAASYKRLQYRDLPCSIVDLVGRSDSDRRKLIEIAVSWGRFPAIGAWSSAFTTDGRQALASAGFVPTELDARARGMPCALLKSLVPEGSPKMSMFSTTWDIRQIDTMHA